MDAPLVSIFLAGKPQGKGRPRIVARPKKGGGGMVPTAITPDATVAYEARLSYAAQQAMRGRLLLRGPLDVLMTATFPITGSWPVKQRSEAIRGVLRPTSKPDCDNIAKVVDALNGIVWADDAQVVDHTVRKFYGAVPGLLIEVRPAELG